MDARQRGAALHRHAGQRGLFAPQRFDLPHGVLVQAAVLHMQLARQRHAAEPRFFARGRVDRRGGPALHPGHQDAAAVGGKRCLRGVKIKTVVDRLHALAGKGVGGGVVAAQQGHRVVPGVELAVGGGAHLLRADEQHLRAVQREEVRAFPHFAQRAAAGVQHGHILPVVAVRAFKQQDAALFGFVAGRRHAVVGSVFGPDLRVAEVGGAEALRQHAGGDDRVGGVLGEIAAVAHGHALGLQLLVAGGDGLHAGVQQQQLAVRQRDGAAGKAPGRVGGGVRREGAGQIVPVQQVGAGGVAPVHGAPDRVVGVVLVKQVVAAAVITEAVGVVHPPDNGRQVKGRAAGRRDAGGLLALKFAGSLQFGKIARHKGFLAFLVFSFG